MTPADLLATIKRILEKGFTILTDEITPDLEAAFRAEGVVVAKKLKLTAGVEKIHGVVDREAVKYARERAAELLKDFAETTPEMLRTTVSRAIEEGWSVGRLRDDLRENYAFSPARALTIARTETTVARRRGGRVSAAAAGARSKHWYTVSADVDAACLNNQAAGWIPIENEFPEGDEPHPNCVCNVDYRTEPGDDDAGGEAD